MHADPLGLTSKQKFQRLSDESSSSPVQPVTTSNTNAYAIASGEGDAGGVLLGFEARTQALQAYDTYIVRSLDLDWKKS
jgi:hypothetical protein